MILTQIPPNIKLKKIPQAIFIPSTQSEDIDGVAQLKQELIRLECEYPIPTYMTETTLKHLIKNNMDITHLDITTIDPGSETPVEDKYIKAEGTQEQLTFTELQQHPPWNMQPAQTFTNIMELRSWYGN
jgi:hypothetical protein